MNNDMMNYKESKEIYAKIVKLISSRKTALTYAVNTAMIFLYWEIGETICVDVLNQTKAEYGKKIVEPEPQMQRHIGKGTISLLKQITLHHFVVIRESNGRSSWP